MAIRKTASGAWQIRIQHRGISVNETHRCSHAQARKIETQIRKQLERDSATVAAGESLTRTFDEAAMLFLDTAPKSYERHFAAIVPALTGLTLEEVPKAASKERDRLVREGYSPCTINRRLAGVRRMLSLAFKEWGWITYPLAPTIRLLSEKGTERHIYLTPKQIKTLIEGCDEDTQYIIRFFASTGLRGCEAFALSADDYRDGRIYIHKQKGVKPRAVPLPSNLRPARIPLPLSRSQFRKRWEKARKAADMEWLHVHDLRHTYASLVADDPNSSIVALRDLLGHSGLQMTSRYAHLFTGKLDAYGESVGLKLA